MNKKLLILNYNYKELSYIPNNYKVFDHHVFVWELPIADYEYIMSLFKLEQIDVSYSVTRTAFDSMVEEYDSEMFRDAAAKNPHMALIYSSIVLDDVFPEGEEVIASSPINAYHYSIQHGRRFEKAEPTMLKTLTESLLLDYYRRLFSDRWYEFEEKLLHKGVPRYVSLYLNHLMDINPDNRYYDTSKTFTTYKEITFFDPVDYWYGLVPVYERIHVSSTDNNCLYKMHVPDEFYDAIKEIIQLIGGTVYD